MDIEKDYIQPMTVDFPIKDEQLIETISMLMDQNYIKGNVISAWGRKIIIVDYDSLKITPQGIGYLAEDKNMRKVCDVLEDAKSIYSLFLIS